MKPLTFLPLAALVAAAPQPSADLTQVQRHLQGLTTMTAAFSQTDRNGNVVTGTLTLKQPGRIRFQPQKGVPWLVVADGGALTFIDYSVKQVQRYPVRNTPMGVLIDPARGIQRYARVVPTGNDRVISVEAHDPKHPEYGRITLVFARDAAGPAGLVLQGWVQLDSQGNRTTIRLSNQRFGVPVGDDQFQWTDPRKGVGRR